MGVLERECGSVGVFGCGSVGVWECGSVGVNSSRTHSDLCPLISALWTSVLCPLTSDL